MRRVPPGQRCTAQLRRLVDRLPVLRPYPMEGAAMPPIDWLFLLAIVLLIIAAHLD